MYIIRNFHNIPEHAKNTVIALGNFDGIHLGHQEIIKTIKETAKKSGKKAALMTFEPHPQTFFNDKEIKLFGIKDKLNFLKEQGLDYVFLVKFNRDFADLTAPEFVDNILVKSLNVSHIVIGYDFIFGKNRGGNAEFLKEQATKQGFGFDQIIPHKTAEYDLVYSSSAIRKALSTGEIKKAAKLLGKNYFIRNRVRKGDGRGKDLGFCTINLNLENLYLPKFGVYAVRVKINDQYFNAVANLGVRPTFEKEEPNLEVHIFNFNDDLYGQKVKVEFIDFIRAEQKFASQGELIKQIESDCNKAKEILNAA